MIPNPEHEYNQLYKSNNPREISHRDRRRQRRQDPPGSEVHQRIRPEKSDPNSWGGIRNQDHRDSHRPEGQGADLGYK